MTEYSIDCYVPPDREQLVASIMLEDRQFRGKAEWAEINQEHGALAVEFYLRPDGEPWRIDYETVIGALTSAAQMLQQRSR